MFITNVVDWHPRNGYRLTRQDIDFEIPRLRSELKYVSPKLVICLGRIAATTLRTLYPEARELRWPFTAPRKPIDNGPALLFALHPSAAIRAEQAAGSRARRLRTSICVQPGTGFAVELPGPVAAVAAHLVAHVAASRHVSSPGLRGDLPADRSVTVAIPNQHRDADAYPRAGLAESKTRQKCNDTIGRSGEDMSQAPNRRD